LGRCARVVVLFASLAPLGCASGRDVIPDSHDVQGAAPPPDAGPRALGGYAYVARRPLGAVALAEARGIDDAAAGRVVDHLADALAACAEGLAHEGKLVDGAARIAAEIAPDGTPTSLALKVAPGGSVAANAILCFITPFKLTSFPLAPPEQGLRGIAVEATWGPSLAAPPPLPAPAAH
jgi:hypothetical protein